MKKEILYILLDNYAEHEIGFMPGAVSTDATGFRKEPKYMNKMVAPTMEPVNGITEFYITGDDATGCVKSTCFNMRKAGYTVHVLSDCVTSYDLKKLPEMFAYYAKQGCEVLTLDDIK